jgi:hypothetical protein
MPTTPEEKLTYLDAMESWPRYVIWPVNVIGSCSQPALDIEITSIAAVVSDYGFEVPSQPMKSKGNVPRGVFQEIIGFA